MSISGLKLEVDFLVLSILLVQTSLHSKNNQNKKNLTGCLTRYTTTSVATIFKNSTEIYTSAHGKSLLLNLTILLEFSMMLIGTIMSTLIRKNMMILNSLARKFLQI